MTSSDDQTCIPTLADLDYLRSILSSLETNTKALLATGESFPAIWRNAVRLQATIRLMALAVDAEEADFQI